MKLTSLDFQSISSWPPGTFHFFVLDPLEILVFPSNFNIPPWKSDYFPSTPWKFPLISSTGGFNFFLEKPNVNFLLSLNSKRAGLLLPVMWKINLFMDTRNLSFCNYLFFVKNSLMADKTKEFENKSEIDN